MKATLFRITSILAVVLALTAASAYGQGLVRRETFVVPFDFNVGQKVLPKGTYTFSSEKEVVRIQSRDGKQNLFALPYRTRAGAQSPADIKLTFNRYGESYYLAQIWLPDGIGRELKRQLPAGTEVSMNVSTIDVPGAGH
ncbi:MAG TPA: hypothetical protein VI306_18585 [Pyrinomonadaceae bacterium]